jgi:hypothetical protein
LHWLFATDNGRLYLGVSQVSSAADYAAEVAAVPQAVYPERIKLTGVGDEAILMKGPAVLRVIWSPAGASAESSCFLSSRSQPTTCSSGLQSWR